MKIFIFIFLTVLLFSIIGFFVNEAEIYSLSKRTNRMVKSRKKDRRHKIQKK